eukprot:308918-Amphidinium_carterae.2
MRKVYTSGGNMRAKHVSITSNLTSLNRHEIATVWQVGGGTHTMVQNIEDANTVELRRCRDLERHGSHSTTNGHSIITADLTACSAAASSTAACSG